MSTPHENAARAPRRVRPASSTSVRRLSALVAALAAVAGLSACRTNVGVAATVQGHQISESDVTSYLTADAKPVVIQETNGPSLQVAPRTFVVEVLVYNRLLEDVLAATPDGGPSSSELGQLRTAALGGKTAAQVGAAQGIDGYSSSLYDAFAQRLAYSGALNAYQQKGVDVSALVSKVHIRVSLSPRYGTWNAEAQSIDTSPGAAVPGFVTLQPTLGATDSAAAANP